MTAPDGLDTTPADGQTDSFSEDLRAIYGDIQDEEALQGARGCV